MLTSSYTTSTLPTTGSPGETGVFMPSGIYAIVNTTNSKAYIGSATDLDGRSRTHFAKLRNGVHPSKHLQAAFAKYGGSVFSFRVLEEVAPEALLVREQFWIDTMSPAYNKRKIASSNAGIINTPEWRAAQSAGLKAFRSSPAGAAHKDVLAEAARRSWADPVKRANRVIAIKAAWTPEKRAVNGAQSKARASHLSPEGKHFGSYRVWTPEERAKMGAKAQARWDAKRKTEADVAAEVTAINPAWTAVEMTGVLARDKVLIRCATHNQDQWQSLAKVRYASRGCKLCGFQRSSELQKGKPKSLVSQSHSHFQE